MTYNRPPHASHHCRHYSYITDPNDWGPKCAAGVDLRATDKNVMACMPNDKTGRPPCHKREEYTDDEREAWKQYTIEASARLFNAVAAVPAPIPLDTSGVVECPNCGGKLHYSRWNRGASIGCETTDCCGASFSIKPGVDWP